jgi:glycosyltransferase involved in cell wall biosynthesis
MGVGLTLVVNTFNEAGRLPACLESVRGIADEVVVCDMHSTDATAAIARAHGARVVFHEPVGFVEPARQFAIDQAAQPWVLVLDADERLSPPLQVEIRRLLEQDPPCDAYHIGRRNWMFGKFVEHGSWRLEAPVRLFRRGQVHWPATIHRGPTIQGSVGRLSHPFIHVAHTTVARFVEKLNRYTDIEAEALFESGARSNLALACLGALRAFLGQYVRLQGYRLFHARQAVDLMVHVATRTGTLTPRMAGRDSSRELATTPCRPTSACASSITRLPS